MKALLLSFVFPPCVGGSGRWLFEIYRRLAPGAAVVATQEHRDSAACDEGQNLAIHRLSLHFNTWGFFEPAGAMEYWRVTRLLMRLAREEFVGAVHCATLLPEGWLAWLLKWRLGLPYWVFVHGEELNYGARSRQLQWMMRRVLASASGVIANSKNTAQILAGDWRVAEDKLRTLTPGVDATKFCPAGRDAAERRRLGWGERPVVLTVGRLQKRKGQDMLIRAVDQIRRHVPDVLYSVVGDGQERRELERLIGELGLASHVELRGEPSDDELIKCYQQCDLFALPNRTVDGDFEGFGMVLVEAAACGRPVIGGDSGGTRETMQPGRTGLIVDCTRPEPLGEAVAELLVDMGRRNAMGRAGRELVLERFDWPPLAAKAAQILGLAGRPAERSRAAVMGQPAEAVVA